jgi:hypothetical protein
MRLLTSAPDLAIADRCSRTENAPASGAVPITIKADGARGFAITSTGKITGTVPARWWIAEQDATPVARAAPLLAGAARTYPPSHRRRGAISRLPAGCLDAGRCCNLALGRRRQTRRDGRGDATQRAASGVQHAIKTRPCSGARGRSRLHEPRPCNETAQGSAGPDAAIRRADQRCVRRSVPVTSPETRQLQESGRARFRRRCVCSGRCCSEHACEISRNGRTRQFAQLTMPNFGVPWGYFVDFRKRTNS